MFTADNKDFKNSMHNKIPQVILRYTDIRITMNTYCDVTDEYRQKNTETGHKNMTNLGFKHSYTLLAAKSGIISMVPLTGLEPVRIISPRDFKSLVSAYSTTAACSFQKTINIIQLKI